MMRRSPTITMAEYSYTILLQPEPGGGYVVRCPALPGLATFGRTAEEARAAAAAAIRCHLAGLRQARLPIPESDAGLVPLIDRISVTMAA